MSTTAAVKGKTGNSRTRGEPTGHSSLRFVPGHSLGGSTGTLLIEGTVSLHEFTAEARRLGAVTRTGGVEYFVVEFATGIYEQTGAGGRTEDRLREMLRSFRESQD